jgi:TRAP-type C4-dicarboxylate transport system permease large subunit
VLLIVAVAGLFSWFLTVEGTATPVGVKLFSVSENELIFLLVVNLFLLVLGLFPAPLSAMIMSIPLVVPKLTALGLHPVHIGVIMFFNLIIGLLTPPLGLTIYITRDISGASICDIVWDMLPYYGVLVLPLLVVIYQWSLRSGCRTRHCSLLSRQ